MKEKIKKTNEGIVMVRLINGYISYSSNWWHCGHENGLSPSTRLVLKEMLTLNATVEEIRGISIEAWLEMNMPYLKAEMLGKPLEYVVRSYSGTITMDRICFFDSETFKPYKGHWSTPVSVWISEE